jgi:hypothetical protein
MKDEIKRIERGRAGANTDREPGRLAVRAKKGAQSRGGRSRQSAIGNCKSKI